MHEMSIATALVDQVLAVGRENDAVRVVEVEVELGEMQQVAPEAREVAFAAVTSGTMAEGATLTLNEKAIRARCRKCGGEFSAQVDMYACPQCQLADVEIIEGDDILLRSVVCDQE